MISRDKNKIVVFGALNMDLIVETQRPAGPGETAEGTRFYTAPGGKGGNQAVAASRLADGVDRVLMVGRIGNDVFGRQLRSYLEKQRVNTKHVQTDMGQSSGIAVIFVETSGQNYVNPVYGANARCDDWQASDAVEAMKKAAVLLVQQETPLAPTLTAMRAAREMGVTVILDPAPARDLPDGFLEQADIITPNQLEAEALAGVPVTNPEEAGIAARRIRSMGIPTVIVTLGEQGAYVEADDYSGHIPAFDTQVVASVAAGDAFNGAMGFALCEGMPLRDAVTFGSAAAAVSVSRPGSQESMATREEVDAQLTGRRRQAGIQ